jgi:hypothetical protein
MGASEWGYYALYEDDINSAFQKLCAFVYREVAKNFPTRTEQIAELEYDLQCLDNLYPQAQRKMEALTGLKRSETQVRHFIKGLGLKYRKVGMLPAKAAPVAQAQFKTEKLEPVLAEAQQGQRKVFFVDAAHFVLAPFLGYLWSFVRLFIPAPSGRQRFNVLAALDAISHELIMVTNESYINAESVCQLLLQV